MRVSACSSWTGWVAMRAVNMPASSRWRPCAHSCLTKSQEHGDPISELKARIGFVSLCLDRKAREEWQSKAMGCTLTGLVWMQGMTLLVNVGDSRTYRLRDGILRQLTLDQTLLERDMVPLPAGKALYNCIGAGCDTEPSVQDITGRVMELDRIQSALTA